MIITRIQCIQVVQTIIIIIIIIIILYTIAHQTIKLYLMHWMHILME